MHDLNDVQLKKILTLVGARIEIVLLIRLDQYGPEGTDRNLKINFILIKARDGHAQARYGHVKARDGHVQARDGHVQVRDGTFKLEMSMFKIEMGMFKL